jgi:hypothetical protein
MRARLLLTGLALAVAFVPVFPAPERLAAAAQQASASETVAGEVTKIDLERSRVTIRSRDGSVHEFEASAETLKDLKIGDYIEARRRTAND